MNKFAFGDILVMVHFRNTKSYQYIREQQVEKPLLFYLNKINVAEVSYTDWKSHIIIVVLGQTGTE